MKKTLLFIVVAVLVVVGTFVGAMLLIKRSETKDSHYQTYDQAVAAGEVERGWIPAFVPRSARNIEETHDLATNYQWLSFVAPPADLQQAFVPLQRISLYEARSLGFRDSWFAPPHPFELDKTMLATPRGSIRVFKQRSEPWSLCAIADWSTGQVFVWSCDYKPRANSA